MLDQSLELGKKMLIENTLSEIEVEKHNQFISKLITIKGENQTFC